MASASPSLSISAHAIAWQALVEHIQKWFHAPDIQALSIALAVARAHECPGDPIWLFVIGPSGSGKTSIVCNCLGALPNAYICGDITPKAFLSGKVTGAGTATAGLLYRVGSTPLMIFKDFTTIVSKRKEDQAEIVAALREIYDGRFGRDHGGGGQGWTGKMTVIAAVTEAIDRVWSFHRDLGERFMQLRWPNSSPMAVSRAARAQMGKESLIAGTMRDATVRFFQCESFPQAPALDDRQAEMLDSLATMVAKLRPRILWERESITDVCGPEEPCRIIKALTGIACHHASLFRRQRVVRADIEAAIRVGFDSIPRKRAQVLQAIPPDASISSTDIRKLTGILKDSLTRIGEELAALGAVETITGMSEISYRFCPEFLDLWTSAHYPADE